MFNSEPIELSNDTLSFELVAGEYSEIIKLNSINTGGLIDDMFSDFGL